MKDLVELTEQFPKVKVVVSSSGFYDFLATNKFLQDIKDNLTLYWVSCAPDSVSESKWGNFFYKLNGFTYSDHKWFAYPNLQILKLLNPECSPRKVWRDQDQKNVFYKNDLESRFYCYGFLWDYISADCFNFVLRSNLDLFHQSPEPIDIETHVLAATKDGYWDDSRPANIERTVDKYILNKRILYKETSHLWVVTPENLSELFG